jgi:hypothetical protein
MDYAQLLTRAGRLAWRYKLLWLLGLPATAGSWLLSFSGRLLFRPEWLQRLEDDPAFLLPLLENGTILRGAIVAVVILFVAGLAVWLVSTVAEGGLIWAAAQLEHGRSLSLSEVWRQGVGFLARFIIVDTLVFLPLFLLVVTAMLLASGGLIGLVLAAESGSAPRTLLTSFGVGSLVVFCLILLAVPVLVLTLLFRQLSFRGVVLHNLRPMPSIRHAGFVLRRHWLSVGVVLLFVWALNGLINMAILLPNSFLMMGRLMATQSQMGWGWLFDGGGLLLESAKAAVFAVLFVFTAILWTLAYQEFTPPGVES